jgi:hypothetical protein
MKVRFTERADRDYSGLLPEVRRAFGKQLGFLLNGIGHPYSAGEEIRRVEQRLASTGEPQLAILLCDSRG